MANGKQRDAIRTDIVNYGLPTLSAEADDYLRRMFGLSDINQAEALERELDRWLTSVEITSVSRWLADPSMYLANIEPEKLAALAEVLKQRLDRRVEDARRRGWELE